MRAFAKLSTAVVVVCLLAVPVSAQVVLNEVLGSTTSDDTEFIELYNAGGAAVDITGWYIDLWDSDAGTSFGLADDGAPFVFPTASIPAGGWYLLANDLAEAAFSVTADLAIQQNAIENSSYTMILKDSGGVSINSLFMTDGGDGDAANDAGTLITPDLTFGPDGTYLPAGCYRVGDGNPTLAMLEFSPIPAPSATPGGPNIPEPASLTLLALGGLAVLRRRR